MICIPIIARAQAEALCEIERSVSLADVLELRMDLIGTGNLIVLIDKCRSFGSRPKILITNRKKTEGGGGVVPYGISSPRIENIISLSEEKQRIGVLKEAVKYGADYIDIELSTDRSLIKELVLVIKKYGSKTQLIMSYHDFRGTPSTRKLRTIFQDCLQTGASIVKIVTTAIDPSDNTRILELISYARRQGKEIIAFCMGERGKISRVMAPMVGSLLSFASSRYGAESALGQFTVEKMQQIMEMIQGNIIKEGMPFEEHPKIFVLLGNPVKHSLSPAMHNAAFRNLKINGQYLSFCVEDIASAVSGIRGLNIRGASVTIPFKVSVMPFLDKIHPDALKIGAVNTIVNDAGLLTGYNTDWQGLVAALKAALDIRGKRIIVLGAGGTARSAVVGILREGGTPVVVNRTPETGERLAREFKSVFYQLKNIGKIRADGLINTTPVGMAPNAGDSPVPAEILGNYRLVMDVIYNPLKTKLLIDAEKAGCITISGLDMFVHQGAEQFKLWTGQEPLRSLMREIVLKKLEVV
jgi:shikimate dehydrogenase/3-dehydroquinate dehydratase type I